MPADDLRLDRRDDRRDGRNRWLGRRQCRLSRGFLTRIGKFKPVGLGQRCLGRAGADCRHVHGCRGCQDNRCFDSLADQQGAEHGQTRNRKPHSPNHYSKSRPLGRQEGPERFGRLEGRMNLVCGGSPALHRVDRTAEPVLISTNSGALRLNAKLPSMKIAPGFRNAQRTDQVDHEDHRREYRKRHRELRRAGACQRDECRHHPAEGEANVPGQSGAAGTQ